MNVNSRPVSTTARIFVSTLTLQDRSLHYKEGSNFTKLNLEMFTFYTLKYIENNHLDIYQKMKQHIINRAYEVSLQIGTVSHFSL